jgi:glycosyltransferase involved in cell wall biosynthesis
MKPRVSIMIPVFNRVALVRESIDSVLAQDFADFEIVLVDGASTDGTWEVCCDYAERDRRVRAIRQANNDGPVAGWRQCLDSAEGELGTFLWSDDLLEREFLSSTVPALSDPEVAFVFAAARIGAAPNAGTTHYSFDAPSIPSLKFVERSLDVAADFPVSPACALFRLSDLRASFRASLPTTPAYDLSDTGAGTDMLLFIETARRYPVVRHLSVPLAFFREHPGSITVDGRSGRVARSYAITRSWIAREVGAEAVSRRILVDLWIDEIRTRGRFISPFEASNAYGGIVHPLALLAFGLLPLTRAAMARVRKRIPRGGR